MLLLQTIQVKGYCWNRTGVWELEAQSLCNLILTGRSITRNGRFLFGSRELFCFVTFQNILFFPPCSSVSTSSHQNSDYALFSTRIRDCCLTNGLDKNRNLKLKQNNMVILWNKVAFSPKEQVPTGTGGCSSKEDIGSTQTAKLKPYLGLG